MKKLFSNATLMTIDAGKLFLQVGRGIFSCGLNGVPCESPSLDPNSYPCASLALDKDNQLIYFLTNCYSGPVSLLKISYRGTNQSTVFTAPSSLRYSHYVPFLLLKDERILIPLTVKEERDGLYLLSKKDNVTYLGSIPGYPSYFSGLDNADKLGFNHATPFGNISYRVRFGSLGVYIEEIPLQKNRFPVTWLRSFPTIQDAMFSRRCVHGSKPMCL
jgi:hypothetical protein